MLICLQFYLFFIILCPRHFSIEIDRAAANWTKSAYRLQYFHLRQASGEELQLWEGYWNVLSYVLSIKEDCSSFNLCTSGLMTTRRRLKSVTQLSCLFKIKYFNNKHICSRYQLSPHMSTLQKMNNNLFQTSQAGWRPVFRDHVTLVKMIESHNLTEQRKLRSPFY